MRRLLVISNGIGEDSVAAEIARNFPKGWLADAYPMLGAGRAYRNLLPVVGPRAYLPSEGSRVASGTVRRDLAGGALKTVLPALKFLRSARRTYDGFLVVGDFIGVGACWLAGARGVVYLDVYKTGYGRNYSRLEKRIIARTCRTVFCRSERLAIALEMAGVDARAAGNVMMDAIPSADYDTTRRRLRLHAVTLLPGSRERTAENFALQVEALRRLPDELKPDVFVALADGVFPGDLAAASGLTVQSAGSDGTDGGRLTGSGLTVHLARGALRELIEAADIVLSQAGTATIQALGLGRPVVTFVGPDDRMKRFEEENRLFGESRILVPDDPGEMTAIMLRLLTEPNELARRGAIGRQRIGPPGAMRHIIGALADPARAAPPGQAANLSASR